MSRKASAISAGSGGTSRRPVHQDPNTRPKQREADPRLAYRTALAHYKAPILQAILLAIGASPETASTTRTNVLAEEISDLHDKAREGSDVFAGLPEEAANASCLFALTETTSISLAGLRHAIGIMGGEPDAAILALLERGLLAIDPAIELQPVDDFRRLLAICDPVRTGLYANPSINRNARTPRLGGGLTGIPGDEAGQIRETDGLEPILRLGALWQMVGSGPLRQTQQGSLYKRDRERLDENAVLNASSPDSPVEVADIASFWLTLAIRVGLVEIEASGERLQACPPEFWAENSVHLRQMIATSWLGLRAWQEIEAEGEDEEGEFPFSPLAIGYARLPIMIWLSSLGDGEWITVEDLAEHLGKIRPGWDRLLLLNPPEAAARTQRGAGSKKKKDAPDAIGSIAGVRLLEAVLLNLAFRNGLVRVGEEKKERRRVVQLTQLGRYVLSLGTPPPVIPAIDQFLFVQPNFELIAYRQGLTPRIIGQLSRFAHWSNIGAAIELKLTHESVVLGLDGGLTPDQMMDILGRHSSRPLPTGIIDAVKSWATRRDRVTCYAKATLIEFGSRRELEQALELWTGERSDRSFPVAISDRLLLVEDDQTIPFDKLKLVGSRDYRHPPEICLSVDEDGVSLTLDPAKADLLVDAELSRFTDEIVTIDDLSERERENRRSVQAAPLRRRFAISIASLDRAIEAGMTEAHLAEWFPRRTGQPIPPATRLMLLSRSDRIPKLQTARMLVLKTHSPEVLDGLLQHPTTRDLLEERLGDATVVITDTNLPRLEAALKELGIGLAASPD